MSKLKNHDSLYFDKLIRSEKAESLLSLIQATYHVIKNNSENDIKDIKEKIALRLQAAYDLFRDDKNKGSKTGSGTYEGTLDQFESQYTLGLEMGIWESTKSFSLNPLAIQVAENRITIRQYLDRVLLNYVQPINNQIVNPFYIVINYMFNNDLKVLKKEDIDNAFKELNIPIQKIENRNGLYNFIQGTDYFDHKKGYLEFNDRDYNLKELVANCNLKFVGKPLDEVNQELDSEKAYSAYLCSRAQIEQKEKNKSKNEGLIGYNKIYYGIPGCGKSYYIENTVLNDVDKKNNVFRTTFYLDYSNSDFIGQIYPNVDNNGTVSYEPVPGPFTKALERALSTDEMVYLVIEEINRGNAAAIFGDTFQLLDRLKKEREGRVAGDSEYPISNAFIEGYFEKKGIDFIPGQIYIPHNLTLLATMNTSDQNVFPLDTAFKRRWNKQRVVNNWSEVGPIKDKYIPYSNITWGAFAQTINKEMIDKSSKSDTPISEDKQMGAYFADESMLSDKPMDFNQIKLNNFANNILDYLYNDVTKFDNSVLFNEKLYSSDTIYEEIDYFIHDEKRKWEIRSNSGGLFSAIFSDDVNQKLQEIIEDTDHVDESKSDFPLDDGTSENEEES